MAHTAPPARRADIDKPLPIKREVTWEQDQYDRVAEAAGQIPVATFIRNLVLGQIAGGANGGTIPAVHVPPDAVGVPILGSIAAGSPVGSDDEADGMVFCSVHPSGPGYGYIRVHGDSMDQIVPDGALALIKPGIFTPGDIVALELRTGETSEFTLKLYKMVEGRQWFEPMSNNPVHKPIVFSRIHPKNLDEGVQWMDPDHAEIKGVFTHRYIV